MGGESMVERGPGQQQQQGKKLRPAIWTLKRPGFRSFGSHYPSFPNFHTPTPHPINSGSFDSWLEKLIHKTKKSLINFFIT